LGLVQCSGAASPETRRATFNAPGPRWAGPPQGRPTAGSSKRRRSCFFQGDLRSVFSSQPKATHRLATTCDFQGRAHCRRTPGPAEKGKLAALALGSGSRLRPNAPSFTKPAARPQATKGFSPPPFGLRDAFRGARGPSAQSSPTKKSSLSLLNSRWWLQKHLQSERPPGGNLNGSVARRARPPISC